MATEEDSAPVPGSPVSGSAGPGQGPAEHGFSVRCLQPGRPTTAAQRQEALRKALERYGRTDFGNLGPRCGSDHRLKSLAGWKVTQTRPGEFTTTTPGNQTYTTKPGDTGAGPPSFTDRVLDALPEDFRQRLKRKKPPPEADDTDKDPPF